MNMETLARSTQAALKDKKEAARLLLKQLEKKDQRILERLLDAATWKERDLASFDASKYVLPIEGAWGRFYLVSTFYRGEIAPRLTPRGLKALAQGLVDVISEET